MKLSHFSVQFDKIQRRHVIGSGKPRLLRLSPASAQAFVQVVSSHISQSSTFYWHLSNARAQEERWHKGQRQKLNSS